MEVWRFMMMGNESVGTIARVYRLSSGAPAAAAALPAGFSLRGAQAPPLQKNADRMSVGIDTNR